ncbi:MAG: hypothetical protein ACOXZ5_09465 [Syntrophomonadaceae bacterium]|jgi:hypothetical protein
MRIYSSEPISDYYKKMIFPLSLEDLLDENVYEDMWLPLDDKYTDIRNLIDQNRIEKD